VLLLVHFQQRSQEFDAMLFLHYTLSVFKLAYNRTIWGCFHSFTGFLCLCVVRCSPGGGGKVVWPSGQLIFSRLLYAATIRIYGACQA
jgi:hypothetical protein